MVKDVVIIVLLTCGIILFLLNIVVSTNCPICKQQQQCPQYPTLLDLEFSSENFPSKIHYDLFNKNNVWQGGYQLDTNVHNNIISKQLVN